MKERILEFLKSENKSSTQFADEIGVQPSSISHILSGRNNPSLDFVTKMLVKYPWISTDWLLFGKGSMLIEKSAADLFYTPNDESVKKDIEHPVDMKSNTGFVEKKIEFQSGINKDVNKHPGALRIVYFFPDNTFIEYFPAES